MLITSEDFQIELDRIFRTAENAGVTFIDVRSGDLHQRVGNYPGNNHRMPVCCSVMRQNIRIGDVVLDEPPKGNGANLVIRYKIPR